MQILELFESSQKGQLNKTLSIECVYLLKLKFYLPYKLGHRLLLQVALLDQELKNNTKT